MSGPTGTPDFVLGLPATGYQNQRTPPQPIQPQAVPHRGTEYTGPVTRARTRQEQARVANTCTCLGTNTKDTPHNDTLPSKGSHPTHSLAHKKTTTKVTSTHHTSHRSHHHCTETTQGSQGSHG